MSAEQTILIAITFVLILGSALAAHFGWLPRGRARVHIVFWAGCAAVLSMWLAGLPPSWFEGSWKGFGYAALFLVWALANKGEKNPFGVPLTLGMGLVLFGLNLFAAVKGVL